MKKIWEETFPPYKTNAFYSDGSSYFSLEEQACQNLFNTIIQDLQISQEIVKLTKENQIDQVIELLKKLNNKPHLKDMVILEPSIELQKRLTVDLARKLLSLVSTDHMYQNIAQNLYAKLF